MAPKQIIKDGLFPLHSGGMLPISTYHSELLRIRLQALNNGYTGSDKFLNRLIKRNIRSQYGLVCFVCEEVIEMHWKHEPLLRELQPSDVQDCPYGGFHVRCWHSYQRAKRNQRRRLRYVPHIANPVQQQLVIADVLPGLPPLENIPMLPPGQEAAIAAAAPEFPQQDIPPPGEEPAIAAAAAVLIPQDLPIPVPGVANPDIKRPGAELEAAIADRADAENEAEEDKLTVEYGPIRLPPCGRRCLLRNIYVADFGAYAGRCGFPCRLRAHHTGACQCYQQHEVEEAAIAAAGSGELEFHVGE